MLCGKCVGYDDVETVFNSPWFWKQIQTTFYRSAEPHIPMYSITTYHHASQKHTTDHYSTYSDSNVIYPCITRYHHLSQQYISTYLTKNQNPSLLSPFDVICQQKYTAWKSHKFWYDVTKASQHSNLRSMEEPLINSALVSMATSATLTHI